MYNGQIMMTYRCSAACRHCLVMAAPGLRYHPAADTILRMLSPHIEIQRVGLNENWRAGIQVIFRQ